MKNQLPLLSVIIPSKDRQENLNLLLSEIFEQAIATQLAKLIEIIIVDDGSQPPLKPRAMPDVIRALWLRLNRNSGAPTAREYGFSHAKGRFIHFHDSDDNIGNNWVNAVILQLKKQPDLDLLISARLVFHAQGNDFKYPHYVKRKQHAPSLVKNSLLFDNSIGPLSGVIFSKRVMEKVRFRHLASCQDWDMYLDAIDSKTKIIVDDTFLFLKNNQSSDRISTSARRKLLGYAALYKSNITLPYIKKADKFFFLYKTKRLGLINYHKKLHEIYCKNKIIIMFCFLLIHLKHRR